MFSADPGHAKFLSMRRVWVRMARFFELRGKAFGSVSNGFCSCIFTLQSCGGGIQSGRRSACVLSLWVAWCGIVSLARDAVSWA